MAKVVYTYHYDTNSGAINHHIWKKPRGASNIELFLVGGGGQAGRRWNADNLAGAGSSGGVVHIENLDPSSIDDEIKIVIGQGSAGTTLASGDPGQSGQLTRFGDIQALGGGGGGGGVGGGDPNGIDGGSGGGAGQTGTPGSALQGALPGLSGTFGFGNDGSADGGGGGAGGPAVGSQGGPGILYRGIEYARGGSRQASSEPLTPGSGSDGGALNENSQHGANGIAIITVEFSSHGFLEAFARGKTSTTSTDRNESNPFVSIEVDDGEALRFVSIGGCGNRVVSRNRNFSIGALTDSIFDFDKSERIFLIPGNEGGRRTLSCGGGGASIVALESSLKAASIVYCYRKGVISAYDQSIIDKLIEWGHTVTVIEESEITVSDLDGKDVLIIGAPDADFIDVDFTIDLEDLDIHIISIDRRISRVDLGMSSGSNSGSATTFSLSNVDKSWVFRNHERVSVRVPDISSGVSTTIHQVTGLIASDTIQLISSSAGFERYRDFYYRRHFGFYRFDLEDIDDIWDLFKRFVEEIPPKILSIAGGAGATSTGPKLISIEPGHGNVEPNGRDGSGEGIDFGAGGVNGQSGQSSSSDFVGPGMGMFGTNQQTSWPWIFRGVITGSIPFGYPLGGSSNSASAGFGSACGGGGYSGGGWSYPANSDLNGVAGGGGSYIDESGINSKIINGGLISPQSLGLIKGFETLEFNSVRTGVIRAIGVRKFAGTAEISPTEKFSHVYVMDSVTQEYISVPVSETGVFELYLPEGHPHIISATMFDPTKYRGIWKASQAYKISDIVTSIEPGGANPIVLRCESIVGDGVTSVTEPTWTGQEEVVDNEVTWTVLGSLQDMKIQTNLFES